MGLVTLSDRLARIEARLTELSLLLSRLQSYAESTERMNHAAISRLSELTGNGLWPPR